MLKERLHKPSARTQWVTEDTAPLAGGETPESTEVVEQMNYPQPAHFLFPFTATVILGECSSVVPDASKGVGTSWWTGFLPLAWPLS